MSDSAADPGSESQSAIPPPVEPIPTQGSEDGNGSDAETAAEPTAKASPAPDASAASRANETADTRSLESNHSENSHENAEDEAADASYSGENDGENGGDSDIDMDAELHRLKSHRRASKQASEQPPKTKERRASAKRASAVREALEPRAKPKSRGRNQPRASRASTTEDLPEIEEDEATKERRALEARIDAALRPSTQRRKRLAGDDIEAMQDESISALRDSMRHAALQDVDCIREGQPAINKIRMLPEVVDILQRSSLAYSILDGNLLESVRIWLEPLPDASLPSFEIQKALFSALLTLPIKTIHLRESGLGRVVLFYQKSKRPQPVIKRMAQKLIGDWTRPIIGRSDNYRDKRVQQAEFDPESLTATAATAGLGRRQEPMTSYEEAAARRGRAAVPSASGVSYRVAPLNSTAAYQAEAAAQSVIPGAAKDSQLRRMKAKLMTSGRSGRKKSQVSVEGRDLT